MTVYLIVRAEVPEADRDAFDHWYETEHLPDAKKAFKALGAWRGWSTIDPLSHFAFYEFPDLEAASAVSGSDEIKALIAEFDRVWQGRVTRTRDVVDILQSI
ncbi:MAG: hypothetical protein O3B08_08810 [Proteobacteria bacterium]|nr:hypothetical protein [Pseudomonadota bacterium]